MLTGGSFHFTAQYLIVLSHPLRPKQLCWCAHLFQIVSTDVSWAWQAKPFVYSTSMGSRKVLEGCGHPCRYRKRGCESHCGMCVSRSVVYDSDRMDCSLPGSSVLGILQAWNLEWVVIPFSRGSSQPREWSQVSCIAGRFFTDWATRETHWCK